MGIACWLLVFTVKLFADQNWQCVILIGSCWLRTSGMHNVSYWCHLCWICWLSQIITKYFVSECICAPPYSASTIYIDLELELGSWHSLCLAGRCRCHNITMLMSCVHGPHSRFKNTSIGYWNPNASYWLRSQASKTQLINLGPLHTWAKSRDLVMVRTLDSHPKAVLWVLGKLFYIVKGPQNIV